MMFVSRSIYINGLSKKGYNLDKISLLNYHGDKVILSEIIPSSSVFLRIKYYKNVTLLLKDVEENESYIYNDTIYIVETGDLSKNIYRDFNKDFITQFKVESDIYEVDLNDCYF